MRHTRKHVLKVDLAVMKCIHKPLPVLDFCQLLQTKQEEWIQEAAGQRRSQFGDGDHADGHSAGGELGHVRLGQWIVPLQLGHVLQDADECLVNTHHQTHSLSISAIVKYSS